MLRKPEKLQALAQLQETNTILNLLIYLHNYLKSVLWNV